MTDCSSTTGGELHGYMDTEGKAVVAPRFRRAHEFSEGLAAAAEGAFRVQGSGDQELWGYIDATGAWVIPPSF